MTLMFPTLGTTSLLNTIKLQPIDPQFTMLLQSTDVLEVEEGIRGGNHLEKQYESRVLKMVIGDVGDAVYHHLDGITNM